MPLLPRPLSRPLSRLLRPPLHHNFHTTLHPHFLESTLTATHTLLTTLHTTTALPWSALIPLTAIILRTTITTPTTIYSRHRAFKTLSLQPLLSAWQHPLSRTARASTSTPQAWESSTRAALRRKRKEIHKRHGCQRWKSFAAPLMQLPVWIAASVTLRGMTGRDGLPEWWRGKVEEGGVGVGVGEDRIIPIEESFSTEGALWFQDLLDADPTMILPMTFAFLMFANIEMQTVLHPPSTRVQRVFTNSLRVLPFVALPMIVNMPAALTLYWATSAAFSLVQNMALAKLMPRPEEVKPCKSVDPYKIPEKVDV